MSDTETKPDDIQDFLRPCEPSRDPAYLAWRKAKITRALEAARAAPEDRIPLHEIWKKYGLEY